MFGAVSPRRRLAVAAAAAGERGSEREDERRSRFPVDPHHRDISVAKSVANDPKGRGSMTEALCRTVVARADARRSPMLGALLCRARSSPRWRAAESTTDPRVDAHARLDNAGVAANGMELLANRRKPAGFFDPANPGSFAFVNSDLAFQGDHAFVGNFNGFQIYNISDPANPQIRTAVVCPGGQGEVSVYGNLLFMSAEETRAARTAAPRRSRPVIRCASAASGSSTSRTSTRPFRSRRCRHVVARTRTRC